MLFLLSLLTSGPTAIADAIKDMRALSVLNIASNNLGELVLPGGWTRKFEGFDGMTQWVCTHADGTKQIEHPGKPEGIIALANAIPDMRALSKLIFGGDKYYNGDAWMTPEPATLELGMTEVDLCNKGLRNGGAIIVAAWISHRDKGAMTSLNLASNMIGSEGAKHMAEAIKVV
jgi:hypothetical protein